MLYEDVRPFVGKEGLSPVLLAVSRPVPEGKSPASFVVLGINGSGSPELLRPTALYRQLQLRQVANLEDFTGMEFDVLVHDDRTPAQKFEESVRALDEALNSTN